MIKLPPLVDVQTASSVTGLNVESLYQGVDAGRYLWVWNVSAGNGFKRELRFWSREIFDQTATDGMRWADVMGLLMPSSRDLRQWEVKMLLRVTDPHILALQSELQCRDDDGRIYVPRPALVKFFESRWLGTVGAPRQASLRF